MFSTIILAKFDLYISKFFITIQIFFIRIIIIIIIIIIFGVRVEFPIKPFKIQQFANH